MADDATTRARPTALVTGASQGIGAAVAAALAAAGHDVAVTARRPETLDGTVAAIVAAGGRAAAVALDVTSAESVERAVAEATDALGGIHLLVNNAGVTQRKPALEVSPADWDAVVDVNLKGAFFTTVAFGRHAVARGGAGAVISIASTHALVGYSGRSLYGVSKAGLVQMTRMLAVEWAEHRIRVNAVAPGLVETPSRAAYFDARPAEREAMLSRVPAGRFTAVEEVVGAVLYLASPAAGHVTGHTLVVDGGLTST